MNQSSLANMDRPEWVEERLRYRVLRAVYEHAGGAYGRIVSGLLLEAELPVTNEELLRVVSFLDDHGYVVSASDAFRICITPEGIRYIESLAGRRRSIRTEAA